MKKLYAICGAAVMALAPFTANAYQQIENGMEVTITRDFEVMELVAPFDGTLVIDSNSTAQYAGQAGSSLLYTSPEHTLDERIGIISRSQDERGWWSYTYDIEQNQKYYFFAEYDELNPNPTFTFHLYSGDLSPEVSNVYPQPSTSRDYQLLTYPELQLFFNMTGDVRFESVEMYYQTANGEKSVELDYKEVMTNEGPRFDFDVRNAILSVKNEMLTRTNFTILISKPTIDGKPVTGKYVNTDGNIELEYYYLRQTGVTSIAYPDPFLSYWAPGNPDGIITVTCDAPLAPTSEQNINISFYAGPFVETESGWPRLPGGAKASVSGNTLSVDLCGVERIPENRDLDVVTVYIAGLLDAEGKQVDYEGGNIISIFYIPLQIVEEANMIYEFTPASGALTDVDTVELWVDSSTFLHVTIDGFTFSTETETVELTLDGVTAEEDFLDPGSMYYTIPVPENVKNAYGTIILAAKVTSLDGFYYGISTVFSNPENPETTGIETAVDNEMTGAVYTIDGRIVKDMETLAPGLYIRDGKKILVGR